jgi:hypothetical protein
MEKFKKIIWKIIYLLGYIKVFFNKILIRFGFKKKYKVLFRKSRQTKRADRQAIEDVITKSFNKKYKHLL